MMFFPTPYPDELLYSVLARYGDMVQFPSKHDLMAHLFGEENKKHHLSFLLPMNIGALIHRLPPHPIITTNYLIQNHTLFPYIHPFLDNTRTAAWEKQMSGINNNQRNHDISYNRQLRYCSQCVIDDTKLHGEPFWHRIHQCPGVFICPTHNVILSKSVINFKKGGKGNLFIPLCEGIDTSKSNDDDEFSPKEKLVLAKLARDSKWLLTNGATIPSLTDSIYDKYQLALENNQLSSFSGRMHTLRLIALIGEYLTPKLTYCFNKEQRANMGNNWPLSIVRKRRSRVHQNPLRHLLVINALGYSISDFLVLSENYFGEKPWPCLNPTSDHFKHFVINECAIKYENKSLIGEFSCSCGFTYMRYGPDKTEEDKFTFNKIMTYGSQWEKRFNELNQDPTMDLASIASILQVNLEIITDYLSESHEKQQVSIISQIAEMERDFHRNRWLQTLEKHPEANLEILARYVNSVDYKWLLTNDEDWFNKHRPNNTINKGLKQKLKQVYKFHRDLQLAEKIALAVQTLTSQKPPVRIRKKSIYKYLNLPERSAKSLPISSHVERIATESYEAYSIRAMEWAKQEHQTFSSPSKWMKLAGVYDVLRRSKYDDWMNRLLKAFESSAGNDEISLTHNLLPTAYPDWTEFDNQLAAQIPGTTEKLLKQSDYPRKCTWLTLGQALNALPQLILHTEMLPVTNDCIRSFSESDQAYAERVLGWATQKIKNSNLEFKKDWLVKYLALDQYLDLPNIEGKVDTLVSAHKSALVAKFQLSYKSNKKVNDWVSIDIDLAPKVEEAAKALLQQESPPQKITRKAIALWLEKRYSEIQAYWFDKELAQLPQTANQLSQCLESTESFAIRRLYSVEKVIKKELAGLTRKKLLRLANISEKISSLSEVQAVVDEIFSRLTNSSFQTDYVLTSKDYTELDNEFSTRLESTISEMKEILPPIQITKTSICNHLNVGSDTTKKLKSLPKTARKMEIFEESSVDFNCRKVLFYTNIFKQEQKCPSKALLIRVANVGRHVHRPVVSNTVDNAYESLLGYEQLSQELSKSQLKDLDDCLFVAIQESIIELFQASPPIQITKKTILIHIGKLHLFNLFYTQKLPRAKQAIEEVCENKKQFAERSLEWAVQYYTDNEIAPTNKHELMQRARLFQYGPKDFTEKVNSALARLSIYPTQKQLAFLEEDKYLVDQIMEAKKVISSKIPPRRVNLNTLELEGLNRTKLRKAHSTENYPLTKQTLDNIIESFDDYKFRHLKYVIDQYWEQKFCPTRKQFLDKARVEEYLDQKRFSDLVDSALEELQIFKKQSKFKM